MAELTEKEKQLLKKLKSDELASEKEQKALPESDRVQMPKDKTDFPIGIIPDANTSA